MSRTIIDVNDAMLVRAQRALRTTTKRDTINAALELAAAVESHRRAELLGSFRELIGRLDVETIEQDEADDHADER